MGQRKKNNSSPQDSGNDTKRSTMASGSQPGTPLIPFQPPNGQCNYGFISPHSSQHVISPQSQQMSFMQALNQATPGMPNYITLPQQMSTNTVTSDQFSSLLQRLDNIDKKLSTLNSIQTTIDKFTVHLDNLDKKIIAIATKMSDMEQSWAFESKRVDDICQKQMELDDLTFKMKRLEKEQKGKEREMHAGIQDIRSRSMRDNLLFYGIPEEKDESPVDKVLEVIEHKMKITDAKR
jgi:hypothetical protein